MTHRALWIPSVAIFVLTLRPFLFLDSEVTDRRAIPLVVTTRSNRAVFDIGCGPGEAVDEWLLVVGCLGDSVDEFDVHLSATEIDECRWQPFVPLGGCGSESFGCRSVQNRVAPITSPFRSDSSLARMPVGRLGERRSFSIHVTDGSVTDARHYVNVVARSVAVGDRVQVFLDEQTDQASISHGLLEQLLFEFDHGVVSQMEVKYGTVSDVDEDGRFAVLLSPWLSKLQGGTVSLNGFVRSSDFQRNRPAPFSNRSDVLYLNSCLLPGSDLKALLAHEFTHAIICDRRNRLSAGDEDDWLNEGLAHLSETEFSDSLSNLNHRVARFHNDPSRSPLVVSDYYSAGLWRDHGCRGATWSFMNRLRIRFGCSLVAKLIDSRRNGIGNVERATGFGFAELFRDWSISVFDSSTKNVPATAARPGNGRWHLSGPAVRQWDPQQDLSLTIRGTAFAGIRVSNPGRYRIKAFADCGAELQLSLVPVRRSHGIRVCAHVEEDSDIHVTLSGANSHRVTQLRLEDHSSARSTSHIVSRSLIDEGRTETDGALSIVLDGDSGQRRRGTLQQLTVKAIVETDCGRTICVRSRVTSRP